MTTRYQESKINMQCYKIKGIEVRTDKLYVNGTPVIPGDAATAEALAEVEAQISEQLGSLSAFADTVTNLETTSATHTSEIASLTTSVNTATSVNATQTTDIANLASTVATVGTTSASNSADIASLGSSVATNSADIATLESRADSMQTEIDALGGLDLTTLDTKTQHQSADATSTTFNGNTHLSSVLHTYESSGYVSLGHTTPQCRLDISGDVKATSIILQGTAAPSQATQIGYTSTTGPWFSASKLSIPYGTAVAITPDAGITLTRGTWLIEVVARLGRWATDTTNYLYEVRIGLGDSADNFGPGGNSSETTKWTTTNYTGAYITDSVYQNPTPSHRQVISVTGATKTIHGTIAAWYSGTGNQVAIIKDGTYVQRTRLG